MLVATNVPNLPFRTLKQDQCDAAIRTKKHLKEAVDIYIYLVYNIEPQITLRLG